MNDINKIISELYLAYNSKDLEKGNILINKAKEIDENNVYLKKYIVLFDGLKNQNTEKSENETSKIIKIKGKTLKCKFCAGNILLTKENTDFINTYKQDQTKNLKLICNYCNKENTFESTQKNQFKSLYLNIYIGKEIKINNKKYKVIGGVKYSGTWQTRSSGKLNYIERIVLDNSGDTYYYSESLANRSEGGDSGVDKETEISRKIIPDFDIKIIGDIVLINGKNIKIYETCKVKVESSIGENSKSFSIGEEVITKQFDYKGKKYVLEYESTKTQSEVGVYETYYEENMLSNITGIASIIVIFAIFAIILSLGVVIFQGYGFLGLAIFLTIVAVFIYNKDEDGISLSKNIKLIGTGIIIITLSSISSYSFFNYEKNIKNTDIETLSNSNLEKSKGLYKIEFNNEQKQVVNTKNQTYLRGGTRNTTKTLEGIKFKIETQNDLETLKKIKNQEINLESYDNQSDHFDFGVNKISDYFKNIISAYK